MSQDEGSEKRYNQGSVRPTYCYLTCILVESLKDFTVCRVAIEI